jgi:hypothetical protein
MPSNTGILARLCDTLGIEPSDLFVEFERTQATGEHVAVFPYPIADKALAAHLNSLLVQLEHLQRNAQR